jgi:catechol 2,3-dioxygenase-like lactoylglutathione lyase family enzyme
MLDHTGFIVTDLAKSRRFYDAVAASLGLGTMDNGRDAFLLGKSAEEPLPYLWIGTLRPTYWAEGSRAASISATSRSVRIARNRLMHFMRPL